MHELSMAQGIINAVLDTAQVNNATEAPRLSERRAAPLAAAFQNIGALCFKIREVNF